MSSSRLYCISGIVLMIVATMYIVFFNSISLGFVGGFIISIIGLLGLIAYLVISLIFPHYNIAMVVENFSDIAFKIEIVWGITLNVSFLLGLFGLYRRQSQRAGILGLLGFLLTFLSYLLSGVLGIYYDLFISPQIPSTGISASALNALTHKTYFFNNTANVLLLIGTIVLGISVIRTRVFSRVAGILIVLGGTLTFTVFMSPDPIVSSIASLSATLLYAGFGLAGYTLFRSYQKDVAV